MYATAGHVPQREVYQPMRLADNFADAILPGRSRRCLSPVLADSDVISTGHNGHEVKDISGVPDFCRA